MKRITLTVLLIMLVVIMPAHAFNLRIETENPIEGEPLTLSVSGEWGNNGFHIADREFSIGNDTIYFNFSFYEHMWGGQAITPYHVEHSYQDVEPVRYTILVIVQFFWEGWDGEFEEGDINGIGSHCTVGFRDDPGEFSIELQERWNMISAPISPETNDIREIFAPIVESESLELAKDDQGRFYFPEQDFCNIPRWSVTEGYLVKVTEAVELTIMGEQLPLNTQVRVTENWNMVAYFPREAQDVREAFAPLGENLLLAKDGFGNFYHPEFDFSNMQQLRRGQGYLIKVAEWDRFVWDW